MKLKPCPFCGAAAEVDAHQGYRNITTGRLESEVSIHCGECSVEFTLCHRDVPHMGIDDMVFALGESWNRRVATPLSLLNTTSAASGRPVQAHPQGGALSDDSPAPP